MRELLLCLNRTSPVSADALKMFARGQVLKIKIYGREYGSLIFSRLLGLLVHYCGWPVREDPPVILCCSMYILYLIISVKSSCWWLPVSTFTGKYLVFYEFVALVWSDLAVHILAASLAPSSGQFSITKMLTSKCYTLTEAFATVVSPHCPPVHETASQFCSQVT